MTAPQININTISRDDRIQRWHAAALVGYCASIDARVQTTDATVDIWEKAFSGAPFGLVRDTIDGYLLAYKNADYKPAIDPSDIRQRAKRKIEIDQTRQRSIEGPPQRAKGRAPRRFIEHMQRLGYLTDRDPEEFK